MPLSQTTRNRVALFSICFFWGTTYLAMAEALEEMPPALFLGLRFALAGAVLLLVGMAMGIPLPRGRANWTRLTLHSGLALVMGNFLAGLAVQRVESGLVALIVASYPMFFVALCAVGGEHPPRASWVGIGIGFLGMIVLFWPDIRTGGGAKDASYYYGCALALLVGVAWAVGGAYIRRNPIECHKLMSVAIQNLVAGIALAIVGFGTGEAGSFHPDLKAIAALAYLIVFGTWVAYGAYMYALEHIAPDKVAIHGYVNPIVALALGWVIRDEKLNAWQWVGTWIVLAGVMVVTLAGEGRFARVTRLAIPKLGGQKRP